MVVGYVRIGDYRYPMRRKVDPLRPVRGLLIAFTMSFAIWTMIGFGIVWLFL